MEPVFTTVGQRLRPESVYRRFVAHRVALGFDMVEEGAYRALLRRLRGGGVVCVLADRDVLGASLDVTLLGEPARLPSGPARLAALTGATLLAHPAGVLARRLDDRVRRARPRARRGEGDAGARRRADGARRGRPDRLARPAAAVDGRPAVSLRIGMVCPYSLDVPGGVQAHVLGLAAALRARGHVVEVLAPAEGPVPEFVTPVGRAVGVPYNGSVARVAFGPVAYARVRRWLVGHRFDVLHLHEPTTASISAIALLLAEGPVVATFHTATERSRALAALGGFIQPLMEKVTARIAVSPSARRVQVRHLGGDAVEIPNGVDVAALAPTGPRAADTVAFVGRFDEPRKGMAVLLDALARLGRPGAAAGSSVGSGGGEVRRGARLAPEPASARGGGARRRRRRDARRPCSGRPPCSAPRTPAARASGSC